jgi:hypothetical protein
MRGPGGSAVSKLCHAGRQRWFNRRVSIFLRVFEFFRTPGEKVAKEAAHAAENPEFIASRALAQRQLDATVARAQPGISAADKRLRYPAQTIKSAESAIEAARREISETGPIRDAEARQWSADGLWAHPRLSEKTRERLGRVGNETRQAQLEVSHISETHLGESTRQLLNGDRLTFGNSGLDTANYHDVAEQSRQVFKTSQDLGGRARTVQTEIYGTHAQVYVQQDGAWVPRNLIPGYPR